MAASESWSLRQGIYQALAGNSQVTGLLGGVNIFDDAPVNASYPYLTFGQTTECDWSTGSENGAEHTITLHVWSGADGKTETQAIIETIRAALRVSPIAVDNQHLVNLRHVFSEARHDKLRETYHGIVRYKVVTDPTDQNRLI